MILSAGHYFFLLLFNSFSVIQFVSYFITSPSFSLFFSYSLPFRQSKKMSIRSFCWFLWQSYAPWHSCFLSPLRPIRLFLMSRNFPSLKWWVLGGFIHSIISKTNNRSWNNCRFLDITRNNRQDFHDDHHADHLSWDRILFLRYNKSWSRMAR